VRLYITTPSRTRLVDPGQLHAAVPLNLLSALCSALLRALCGALAMLWSQRQRRDACLQAKAAHAGLPPMRCRMEAACPAGALAAPGGREHAGAHAVIRFRVARACGSASSASTRT